MPPTERVDYCSSGSLQLEEGPLSTPKSSSVQPSIFDKRSTPRVVEARRLQLERNKMQKLIREQLREHEAMQQTCRDEQEKIKASLEAELKFKRQQHTHMLAQLEASQNRVLESQQRRDMAELQALQAQSTRGRFECFSP